MCLLCWKVECERYNVKYKHIITNFTFDVKHASFASWTFSDFLVTLIFLFDYVDFRVAEWLIS